MEICQNIGFSLLHFFTFLSLWFIWKSTHIRKTLQHQCLQYLKVHIINQILSTYLFSLAAHFIWNIIFHVIKYFLPHPVLFFHVINWKNSAHPVPLGKLCSIRQYRVCRKAGFWACLWAYVYWNVLNLLCNNSES